MGFTPLEGLVMATRSGSVDPGLLLWLLEREAVDERARLGLAVYGHRLRAGIGAMAAALGGVDTLVFTGGVGQHAAEIRDKAVAGLGFLGATLDQQANRQAAGDAEITGRDASVRTLVLEAREDLEMAHQTRRLLSG